MILDPSKLRVVQPDDVPDPNRPTPATPSRNQQAFGGEPLRTHGCILIPSAVSRHSWNLVFDASRAEGLHRDVVQKRFALDPRLQAPA